jgi:hypothetical protein
MTQRMGYGVRTLEAIEAGQVPAAGHGMVEAGQVPAAGHGMVAVGQVVMDLLLKARHSMALAGHAMADIRRTPIDAKAYVAHGGGPYQVLMAQQMGTDGRG